MAAPAKRPGNKATKPRPRWRRNLRIAYLVVSGAGFIASLWGGCAAMHRPQWFVPTAIDYDRLPQDKRALVDLLDSIGEALNRGKPITLHVDEQQLNRWLTARGELPDGLELRVDPLQHPQVTLLDDNRIRLAAILPRGGVDLVLSCVLAFECADGHLKLRFESPAVGSLPMPLAWLRRVIDEKRVIAESGAPPRPPTAPGNFENAFVWPNGERRFTIESIHLQADQGELTLRPWPE